MSLSEPKSKGSYSNQNQIHWPILSLPFLLHSAGTQISNQVEVYLQSRSRKSCSEKRKGVLHFNTSPFCQPSSIFFCFSFSSSLYCIITYFLFPFSLAFIKRLLSISMIIRQVRKPEWEQPSLWASEVTGQREQSMRRLFCRSRNPRGTDPAEVRKKMREGKMSGLPGPVWGAGAFSSTIPYPQTKDRSRFEIVTGLIPNFVLDVERKKLRLEVLFGMKFMQSRFGLFSFFLRCHFTLPSSTSSSFP